MPDRAVILDTNMFVAAGFNPESASARILEQVRTGHLRLVWNEQTRREVQTILGKIPPLSWDRVATLFREEDRHHSDTESEQTVHETFAFIPDVDDRKFAALSAATGAVLLTNDSDLLHNREQAGLKILTPSEFWAQYQE